MVYRALFVFAISMHLACAAVAASVGAPHEWAATCRLNVAIYFTDVPLKVLDEVVKACSATAGTPISASNKASAERNRPIQVWYVTVIRGMAGPDLIDSIWSDVPAGRRGSRLTTGKSSLLVFVLVVTDARKLTGYSVGSISGYVVMLVLSRRARALYFINMEQSLSLQRTDIQNKMMREFGEASAE